MNDVRFTFRQWAKNPGLVAVIVLSLAVGIGANTVVFSWIRATLLDAIPGAATPQRLAVVCPQHLTAGVNDTMSLADIESLAAESGVFAGITASQFGTASVRIGDTREWFWGQLTLANFFDVLGVRPVLGRGFVAGEDRPGAKDHVVVISHALWQRRFGGSPDVLGKVLELDERPATIVGVAPAGFHGAMGGLRMDLWVPLATHYESAELERRFASRGWRWLHTVARLRDGVAFGSAKAAADTVGQRLAREFPELSKNTTLRVLRVWESPWGGQALFLPLLRVLAIVAGLLLLLVAANVANLLLARTHARQREMSLRLAVGASSGRVMRQLLTESLLLATLGGAGGVALALWGVNSLFFLMPPTYLPVDLDLRLNGGVLGLTAVITLGVGLLFGLAPAWQGARTNLSESLKTGSRSDSGLAPRQWLRRALVVGEVALALVLLLGMGLCVRSFGKARRVDLGLDPRGVWLAGFQLPASTDGSLRQFYRRLQAGAESLPGVTSTALADWFPLGFEGGSSSGIQAPGYAPAPGEAVDAGVAIVSPRYFKTLGIALRAGREFAEADDEKAQPVAVINEAFARKFFAGRDPVGLTFQGSRGDVRIVGVAQTGKYESLSEPERAFYYVTTGQFTAPNLTLAVRTAGDPRQLARPIEKLAVSLDPRGRPHAAMPFEDYIGAAFTIPRVAATLLTVLGVLALLLAVLGIYAVISQSVGQRTRELGVRLALGARPRDIRWLILRQGLVLAGLGLSLGAVAGLGVARLLTSLLVGTSSADLVTWSVVPSMLFLAALAACWLPASRAARVDPMVALRQE